MEVNLEKNHEGDNWQKKVELEKTIEAKQGECEWRKWRSYRVLWWVGKCSDEVIEELFEGRDSKDVCLSSSEVKRIEQASKKYIADSRQKIENYERVLKASNIMKSLREGLSTFVASGGDGKSASPLNSLEFAKLKEVLDVMSITKALEDVSEIVKGRRFASRLKDQLLSSVRLPLMLEDNVNSLKHDIDSLELKKNFFYNGDENYVEKGNLSEGFYLQEKLQEKKTVGIRLSDASKKLEEKNASLKVAAARKEEAKAIERLVGPVISGLSERLAEWERESKDDYTEERSPVRVESRPKNGEFYADGEVVSAYYYSDDRSSILVDRYVFNCAYGVDKSGSWQPTACMMPGDDAYVVKGQKAIPGANNFSKQEVATAQGELANVRVQKGADVNSEEAKKFFKGVVEQRKQFIKDFYGIDVGDATPVPVEMKEPEIDNKKIHQFLSNVRGRAVGASKSPVALVPVEGEKEPVAKLQRVEPTAVSAAAAAPAAPTHVAKSIISHMPAASPPKAASMFNYTNYNIVCGS